jgi:thiol-disulfide isomerase/thioredoxin
MRITYFFTLILLALFAGCKQPDNTVIINIPADGIFMEAGILKNDGKREEVILQSGEDYRFPLDTVEIRYFHSYSDEEESYTQIFITPGDSVSCKMIKNGDRHEILFEGKNASHYNYAAEKEKVLPWEKTPRYDLVNKETDMDLLTFKRQLQEHRDKEFEFLNDYKKKYKVSRDFINYTTAEINNSYAFNLYLSAHYNKHSIPAGFLDDVKVIPNRLSEYAFLTLRIKYFLLSPDFNIGRIYNTILKEVNPELQSKFLCEMVSYFANRGESIYKESLLQVMEQIEKTSTDSTLLDCVWGNRPYYLLTGTSLPDSILDGTNLITFGKKQKITLRQLLDNYKDQAVYLDIWASWCGPCRRAIEGSFAVKSYLSEKHVAVVYISIDHDENAWQQTAKDLNVTENQYLLPGAGSSPVWDYLRLGGVPRYILFNKNHEMEVLSATWPAQPEDLKDMIERYSGKL